MQTMGVCDTDTDTMGVFRHQKQISMLLTKGSQVINFDVLIENLFNRAASQTNREELSLQCRGNESFHWCQLHYGLKPIAYFAQVCLK